MQRFQEEHLLDQGRNLILTIKKKLSEGHKQTVYSGSSVLEEATRG